MPVTKRSGILRVIAALCPAVAIAGCASVEPVTPVAPDTYVISKRSATALATGNQMLAELSGQANDFCAESKKRVQPVRTSSNDGILFVDFARGRLEFRCVD